MAAAQAAGEILRAGVGRAHDVSWKGPTDLVTEMDRAAEADIVKRLQAAFPEDGLLAEESGQKAGASGRRWIIDPLDGTVNYARAHPQWCVSIALERQGELLVGVVYDPLRDELYAAARGQGATLNGQPLHVGAVESVRGAVISTGFGYDVWTSQQDNVPEFAFFLKRAFAVRCTGSAALDLAAVASGRRDAHWERGVAPYDVAAGLLLVREAGGVATDYAGRCDAIFSGEIIAANPILHAEMLVDLTSYRIAR